MAIDLTTPLQNTVSAISSRTVSPSLETDIQKVAPADQENKTAISEIPDSRKTSQPVSSQKLSEDQLNNTVSRINEYVDQQKRGIRFAIDKDTNRTIVKVLDANGDVLKQFPSEDALAILKNIERNKGLFFEINA